MVQPQSAKNSHLNKTNQNSNTNHHHKKEELQPRTSSLSQKQFAKDNDPKMNNFVNNQKKKPIDNKNSLKKDPTTINNSNTNMNDMIENKYYFRLQKLLDNQSSKNSSNVSSSYKNINLVNTFNQESKQNSRNNSQENSFKNNLTNSKQYSNLKNHQEIVSFKNLSNNTQDFQNQFGQDNLKRKSSANKGLKNIFGTENQEKKSKQMNQIKKILDLSNDNETVKKGFQQLNMSDNQNTQIHQNNQLTDQYQKNNQNQTGKSNQQSSFTNRFMTKSDIEQLEDYVNEKMSFGLLDKHKYQKDVLNDRENDIEILKIMRDFTYFQSTQSTLDFKNRFNIGKVIGQGAYAQVREAFDNDSQKRVAIKIYKKEKLKEGQRLKGIRREVSILVLLKKIEHVGGIIDLVETRNHINIIMEYCEGKDIYSNMKMKFNRKLDEKEAKIIFYQLMTGLDRIHQTGISHRDIKLENILVDIKSANNISSKIIDFGFSTCQLKQQKNRIFCGTPSYMSPEIVRKVYYEGFQADIWASGVVLYAIISGDFPFRGKTDRELYNKICSININYPDSIPSKAKDLMQRIFQFDPYMRPSCKQILADPWFRDIQQDPQIIKNNSFANKYQSNISKFRNSQEQQDQFKEFIKKVSNKNGSFMSKSNNNKEWANNLKIN